MGDWPNWVIVLAIIVGIIATALVIASADTWREWAILLVIFVVGLLLGAVTRSLWALLVPPALALLWMLNTWRAPPRGSELPLYWIVVIEAAIVLGPGLLGVGLGIALGRVLRRRT